jgi:hypothetical protein
LDKQTGRIVLDLDLTEDPLYGQQVFSFAELASFQKSAFRTTEFGLQPLCSAIV